MGFSPGFQCPGAKVGLLCPNMQAGGDLMVDMLPARGSAGARLLKAVLVHVPTYWLPLMEVLGLASSQ